ncbi:hypothetical protein SAMN05421824_0017 [Hyunsoonleella jejuensis]|uniref:Uncharacterized protein n=1 Tax=Hyunsoonleella jejuensis TaxID=419940 RepID=A0A1H8ZSA3_9FLAO|nr:DUF6090 family protein [Hyunsoonleella jejuensis]SEP67131.1 hypothetical protein SAMN05421824_0017 [Hyunsoonleella jejuensis]
MIKFFRKIRQNLLTEGKTGKYLKYAIGEIILVMIGILLALQVNNWNEQRKIVQKEIQVLQALKEDIKSNINNLNKGIGELNRMKSNNIEVIKFFEQKTPYNESMNQYFFNFLSFWDPDFSYASFENLKDQGVDLISNVDLRKSIINLFDVDMDILDIADMARMHILFENMVIPIQRKYFYRDHTSMEPWSTTPFLPLNYNDMIHDMEFYSVCTEIAYRQTRSIQLYKAFNLNAESLVKEINSEIKNLE